MKKLEVPDVLSFGGEKIDNITKWEEKKVDILDFFTNNVYGKCEVERPDDLKFRKLSTKNLKWNTEIIKEQREMYFGDIKIPFLLFLPKNVKTPLPTLVYLMHSYQSKIFKLEDSIPEIDYGKSVLPISLILSRGFALVIVQSNDVANDDKNGAQSGIFKYFKKRGDNMWQVISAWSWALRRVTDYLIFDKRIDAKRLGVLGHSRGGKTALWTAAQDARFSFCCSSNSGNSGAALSRNAYGETIKLINTNFPHWFCQNYKKFNDNENLMPVDQHMLITLIAPRLCYITSSSNDINASPKNEFQAAKLASTVWKLYGVDALNVDTPKLDKNYDSGALAYRLKTGEHSFALSDWLAVLDFLSEKGW